MVPVFLAYKAHQPLIREKMTYETIHRPKAVE